MRGSTGRLGTLTLASVFALLTGGPSCVAADAEFDPLGAELIRELSTGQGSAVGDAHSGTWRFTFEAESCDCPSFEVDGEPQDLCALASYGVLDLQITEGSGVLAIPIGPNGQLGVLSGAIESDGSFNVASLHDATTIVGPLESLQRMDGRFDDATTRAQGWVGQRLIGEVPGGDIDCRSLGTFVADRQ